LLDYIDGNMIKMNLSIERFKAKSILEHYK
jgi:hypothetical protein